VRRIWLGLLPRRWLQPAGGPRRRVRMSVPRSRDRGLLFQQVLEMTSDARPGKASALRKLAPDRRDSLGWRPLSSVAGSSEPAPRLSR
jgi:hypothetical protein